MQLCIDIGNTMTKTALFSGQDLICKSSSPRIDPAEIRQIKTKWPEIEEAILCSVRPENRELINYLKNNFRYLLVFDQETALPFVNLYKTKNTLGKDRLAAVAGANNNFPGRNVLVVDAGTAITYDLIDKSGRYLGGNISPGLTLRFKALHEFTGKLPLVKPRQEFRLLSDKTEDAIAGGVQSGILFEMEGYIGSLKKKYRDLIVIFTGGDAKYFVKKLKSSIFVDPDLVITGLNRILIYNVKKN